MIVKVVQSNWTGIQSQNMLRHGIGYVIQGRKYIYDGDARREIGPGDMFCFSSGNHYTENVPDQKKPFEQIVIYYTPDILSRAIANLSTEYGMPIEAESACPRCGDNNDLVFPAGKSVKGFFATVDHYLSEGIISDDETVQSLKMLELIYLLMSDGHCCIKHRLLRHTDPDKDNFEHIIQRNIFNDVTIETLARQCNRSVTSFKQEFRKYFPEPPHKWLIKQRLMHSRVLLLSGSKPVSEIGNKCRFPNTSHFIKLFKKEFGMTPSVYRNSYLNGGKTKKENTAKKAAVKKREKVQEMA